MDGEAILRETQRSRIVDGALVVFVPASDKGLARHNRALARKSRALDQPVVYVQVPRMGDLTPSGADVGGRAIGLRSATTAADSW
jgi:hypothetical protein